MTVAIISVTDYKLLINNDGCWLCAGGRANAFSASRYEKKIPLLAPPVVRT